MCVRARGENIVAKQMDDGGWWWLRLLHKQLVWFLIYEESGQRRRIPSEVCHSSLSSAMGSSKILPFHSVWPLASHCNWQRALKVTHSIRWYNEKWIFTHNQHLTMTSHEQIFDWMRDEISMEINSDRTNSIADNRELWIESSIEMSRLWHKNSYLQFESPLTSAYTRARLDYFICAQHVSARRAASSDSPLF